MADELNEATHTRPALIDGTSAESSETRGEFKRMGIVRRGNAAGDSLKHAGGILNGQCFFWWEQKDLSSSRSFSPSNEICVSTRPH